MHNDRWFYLSDRYDSEAYKGPLQEYWVHLDRISYVRRMENEMTGEPLVVLEFGGDCAPICLHSATAQRRVMDVLATVVEPPL